MRGVLCFIGILLAGLLRADTEPGPRLVDSAWHVYPGQSIQGAINSAALSLTNKTVKVHEGIYRPSAKGQCLLYFNKQHDGIVVEAVGKVTLTAANPEVADRDAESFPAIVNHVVYFGDGISRKTILRGFDITGANNFVTDSVMNGEIEPNLAKFDATGGAYGRLFFYTDGGGIKIFGRSYPSLENLRIHDNFSSPCGAGISVEHRGFVESAVLITNCLFINNRCLATGSALDLLTGSNVEVHNSLFVGNISNAGTNYAVWKGNLNWPGLVPLAATTLGYLKEHGSGAITLFKASSLSMDRCTITGNFNGLDDGAGRSKISNTIFWQNTAAGGFRPEGRYELDIREGTIISNCFLNGANVDLRGKVQSGLNVMNCPNPDFDPQWVPNNPLFKAAGYRPSLTSW